MALVEKIKASSTTRKAGAGVGGDPRANSASKCQCFRVEVIKMKKNGVIKLKSILGQVKADDKIRQ